MNSEINEAVRILYERRAVKREAHRQLEAVHNNDPEIGIGEDCTGPMDRPCYAYKDDPYADLEWCDFCKRRQPVWEEYQKACRLAAAALRKVLAIGKRLSDEHEEVAA